MNEQQIHEMEKMLGRRLTVEEIRLLRYTEKKEGSEKPSQMPKRKRATQKG